MNSPTERAATEGCTHNTSGTVVVWMMAAKSFSGSNGTLSIKGRTATLLAVAISRV